MNEKPQDILYLLAVMAVSAFVVLPTAVGLMNGGISISDAVTPYWEGFARSFPFIFGILLVVGGIIFGGDEMADLLDM